MKIQPFITIDQYLVQKKYQEYVAECNRNSNTLILPYEEYVFNGLTLEHQKAVKRFYRKFRERKAVLLSQGGYFGSVSRKLKQEVKQCFLPLQCEIFLRTYPKRPSHKDRLNLYGL